MSKVYHPAKYTNSLIPVFAEILRKYEVRSVLDPMAGVGKIFELRKYGYDGEIVAHEIEREWVEEAQRTYPGEVVILGDATDMSWIEDREFDCIVTSPTYGNRMADSHNARDGSRRYTYTHSLGRKLHENNTGHMQWGPMYRATHVQIWSECRRVLRPSGILVVNVKNHYRAGKLVEVSEWHADTIQSLIGFKLLDRIQVKTPGMRRGENYQKRVGHEDIWVFEKKGD